MATYYIDPTAAPAGDGSIGTPFRSFASVPTLAAGDNVYWKRGTTTSGRVLYNSSRGAATTLASPITFGAYGTGDKPRILANGGEYCVDIDAMPGVIVQDLQLGATKSVCAGGVRVLNAGQCTVQRNTMEDRCDYGVRIDNNTAGMFSTINVLDNVIEGTWSNSGILVIWGSAIGGFYEDVQILRNRISNTGKYDTGKPINSPYGIRMIPRTSPVTTSNGTVDLNVFNFGVQVIGNTITNSRAGGLWVSAAGTGGTATLKNRIARNKLKNVGDGIYDSHVLWVGGCRDVFVEDNDIDGSLMADGITSGTGVGIFIDNTNFTNFFDGSKRIIVRRNKIRNTGGLSEGTKNGQLEIAGAGIFSYYSSDIQIIGNEVDGCFNGIGVHGWNGTTGLKGTNITVRGNRVLNSTKNAISSILSADTVVIQENYVDGYGQDGIYVENTGAGAVTNYSEVRNNVVGAAETAYRGGSVPTSQTTPSATRTPAAGNLTLENQFY
jgi:hypothetical protein